MSNTPVDDAAKAESVRLQGLLRWFLSLPLALLRRGVRLLARVFVTPKSPAERRAADKAHQAEVRRGLRGLSPTHDAGRRVP